jgi:type I restriction enzyme S subunit
MSGWKKFRLDNLANVIMGLSPSGETYNEAGIGTPLLNGPTEFGETFPHCTVYTTDPKRICKKGDLIFCVRGSTTGRMNWADKPYAIGRGVCSISGNDELSTRFIKHLLSLNLPALLQITGGGTFPNLRKEDINGFEFSAPENYRKIASILSAYDDLIENNLKRIKLLEELAQRTYEEWFVKFRINGEQLPIDKKTGLPEGWERKKINDISEIISGFAFKSSDYVKDGKFKIVTIKNVQDGYFIPETTDSLVAVPDKVKLTQKLNTGDYILSLTGNVGRTCIVFGNDFLLNQRVAKIIPKHEVTKAFTYFMLRDKATIIGLENLSNGAAQQNLSPINMGNYSVVVPTHNILKLYAETFNPAIDKICNLNLQNQKLKEARDILLPRLMSGKINVA